MKAPDDVIRDIVKFTVDMLDDHVLWGRVGSKELLDLLDDTSNVICTQRTELMKLQIAFHVQRERGDSYRDQARRANKKLAGKGDEE